MHDAHKVNFSLQFGAVAGWRAMALTLALAAIAACGGTVEGDGTADEFAMSSDGLSWHVGANAHQWWGLGGRRASRVDQTLVVQTIADQTFFSMPLYFTGTNAEPGANHRAYIGLQQLAGGHRQAIFSFWNSARARPAAGAECHNFSGEGVGKSCTVPFDFRLNTAYTLRVRRIPPAANGAATYWRGSIVSTSGTTVDIADIEAPRTAGDISAVDSFDEYFGAAVACSQVPRSGAWFAPPRYQATVQGAVQTFTASIASQSIGPCSGAVVSPTQVGTIFVGLGQSWSCPQTP
jgi:hypothetical protein